MGIGGFQPGLAHERIPADRGQAAWQITSPNHQSGSTSRFLLPAPMQFWLARPRGNRHIPAMPRLSWQEVRDRAIRFSRDHAGDRSERAERQTFWNDFFQVFGLRRASIASFEANVRNLEGNVAAIDLLWRGKLLVEHKSFGEDLGIAATQAFTYIEDLTREQRWDEIPRFVLVSDFARFVLYDLEPEEQRDLPLFAGRHIEPHHFTLADFPRNVRHFAFMLGHRDARRRAPCISPAGRRRA